MKYFITLALLTCTVLSAHAQLNQDDLNQIRLIVKAEIKDSETQMKAEIRDSETQMKEYIDLKIDPLVKNMNSQFQHVSGKINILTAIVCALIALIGVIIGVPAWRNIKDNHEQEKINQELREKIEMLTAEIKTQKETQ